MAGTYERIRIYSDLGVDTHCWHTIVDGAGKVAPSSDTREWVAAGRRGWTVARSSAAVVLDLVVYFEATCAAPWTAFPSLEMAGPGRAASAAAVKRRRHCLSDPDRAAGLRGHESYSLADP